MVGKATNVLRRILVPLGVIGVLVVSVGCANGQVVGSGTQTITDAVTDPGSTTTRVVTIGDASAVSACESPTVISAQPSDAVLRAAYSTTVGQAEDYRGILIYEAEQRVGMAAPGGLMAEQQQWPSELYRSEPTHPVSLCIYDSASYKPPIPRGTPPPNRSMFFVDEKGNVGPLLGGFAEDHTGIGPALPLSPPRSS